MKWLSLSGLRALKRKVQENENKNMQAVEKTFQEVYENMEHMDKRLDKVACISTAAYMGNCYCGTAYMGTVSETDTKEVKDG